MSDLPLGERYRFHLYQDEKGAFSKASLVSDEFSYLALNVVTFRVETINLAEGKLHVAREIPEVKNYNGDMEQPPDIGRTELRVNADTRVWKGSQRVIRTLTSSAISAGRTTPAPVRPCLVAFRLAMSLPSWVRGPVLLAALRRAASSCASCRTIRTSPPATCCAESTTS